MRPVHHVLLAWIIAAFPAAMTCAQPANQPERQPREPIYFSTPLSFDDVDVARLTARLARLGIELPVNLQGRVTTRLVIQWPLGSLATPQAYRIHGTLESDRLQVGQLTLRQLQAEARYAEGVVQLEQLQFDVLKQDAPPAGETGQQHLAGHFEGSATIEVLPAGQIDLSARAQRVDVNEWARRLDLQLGPLTGDLRAEVTARTTFAEARSLAGWTAAGMLASSAIQQEPFPPVTVHRARFALEAGQLHLTQLQAASSGGMLRGQGQLELQRPFSWSTDLQLAGFSLATLPQWLRRPQWQAAGTASGKVRLQGTIQPVSWQAQGELELAEPVWQTLIAESARAGFQFRSTEDPTQEVPLTGNGRVSVHRWRLGDRPTVPSAAGEFALNPDQLQLRQLSVQLPTGQLRGALILQLQAPYAWQAQGRGQQLVLSRLGEWFPELPAGDLVAGTAQLDGTFRGQLDPWTAAGEGTLSMEQGRIGDVELAQLATPFRFDERIIELPQLQARLLGGTVQGQVQLARQDAAASQAELHWQQIPLGLLLRQLNLQQVPLEGISQGQLQLSVPGANWLQWPQYGGTASLQIAQGEVLDQPLRDGTMRLRLQAGQLHLDDLQGQMPEGPFAITGQLNLQRPYDYLLQLRLPLMPVTQLQQSELLNQLLAAVPLSLQGQLQLQTQLVGDLVSGRVQRSRGHVQARSLQVDRFFWDQLQFDYVTSPEAIALRQLVANRGEGQLRGSLYWPHEEGELVQMQAAWNDLDFGQLLDRQLPLPWSLQAISDGSFRWSSPQADPWNLRRATLEARVAMNAVEINRQPAGQLQLQVRTDPDLIRLAGRGRLFGGPLQLTSQVPQGDPPAVPPSAPRPMTASVTWRDAQLDQLVSAVTGEAHTPWQGTISMHGRTTQSSDQPLQATGQVELRQLQWQQTVLADRLAGQMSADENRLWVRGIAGRLAGGQLRAAGWFNWRLPQGRWEVDLSRAQLNELVLLVQPQWRDRLQGQTHLRLRAAGWRSWRVTGQLNAHRAELFGLPVQQIRVPLHGMVRPGRGRWTMQSHDVRLSLARGRVRGRFDAQRERRYLALDSRWQFHHVDLQTLLAGAGVARQYSSGDLTGQLRLSGQRIQSAADLRGQLTAELRDARAQTLPLIPRLQPYVLAPGGLSGTVFRRGDLQAQLVQGVVRLERLTLSSPQLQLYADGQYRLRRGQLGLNVVASTGNLQADAALAQVLLSRLALSSGTPVGWLLAANEFVSNRVVHLEVGGTIRQPQIRLRPLQTLQEEVIRFFLRQAVPGLQAEVINGQPR